MTPGPERCLTCGDVAVTGRVVAIEGAEALVDAGGSVERVALDLVAGAHPGDLLLCHAGIALTRLSTDRSDDAARPPRPPDRGAETQARPEEPSSGLVRAPADGDDRPATPDAAPRRHREPTERPSNSLLLAGQAGSRDVPLEGRSPKGGA